MLNERHHVYIMATECWGNYPLNFVDIFLGEDLQYFHDRLRDDAPRLFSRTELRVEIWSVPMESNDVLRDTITDTEQFEPTMRVSQPNMRN